MLEVDFSYDAPTKVLNLVNLRRISGLHVGIEENRRKNVSMVSAYERAQTGQNRLACTKEVLLVRSVVDVLATIPKGSNKVKVRYVFGRIKHVVWSVRTGITGRKGTVVGFLGMPDS